MDWLDWKLLIAAVPAVVLAALAYVSGFPFTALLMGIGVFAVLYFVLVLAHAAYEYARDARIT